jgi:hypothetical protein
VLHDHVREDNRSAETAFGPVEGALPGALANSVGVTNGDSRGGRARTDPALLHHRILSPRSYVLTCPDLYQCMAKVSRILGAE